MVDLTPAQATDKDLSRRFYITAWRWHFYAGLYVAPFIIMLAVTGLMMLWTATLFGRDGEKTYTVEPQAAVSSVSDQAGAATLEIPGQIIQYIAPRTPEQAALFRINQGDASYMVAVDPYRAEVLGYWDRRTGLYDLADNIHGTLLIGTLGDRLIEIAAGFGIVVVPKGHGQLPDAFDHVEHRIALLFADHVTENAAEQPNVVHQRTLVFPGPSGGVGRGRRAGRGRGGGCAGDGSHRSCLIFKQEPC